MIARSEPPALVALLKEVRACRHCDKALPLGPKPVLSVSSQARVLIVGQAPGIKVHDSGVPWNDPSGDRLRQWLELDREQFYGDPRIGIMPMGFCYPGKGASGDLPPRPECAPLWHGALRAQMPKVALVLLIGQYAQRYYLEKGELEQNRAQKSRLTLTQRVRSHPPDDLYLPLPHPSPRNRRWFAQNPWFDSEVLPTLRRRVKSLLNEY